MAGVTTGETDIPDDWINGIKDWPRTLSLLRQTGEALARMKETGIGAPIPYFWPGILLRNPFFLIIVLFHGFRRLLPPYA